MNRIDQSEAALPLHAGKSIVLLVDDDEEQLALFQALLSHSPYRVIAAHDAETALKTLRAVHVDLVICDVNMPTGSGKSLISRIRGSSGHERLPVIAFSAENYREEDLVACGADSFCLKSDSRRLASEVERLLRK
jgi:DNA-binding response OmpR family regulator